MWDLGDRERNRMRRRHVRVNARVQKVWPPLFMFEFALTEFYFHTAHARNVFSIKETSSRFDNRIHMHER